MDAIFIDGFLMTTFYLATPYSKQRSQARAYREALAAQVRLLHLGLDVFCPVVHFHQASLRMRARPPSFWMERCKPWLMACDELLVVQMPGWRESDGIAEETRIFEEIGRPPLYLSWPLTDYEVGKVLARDAGMKTAADVDWSGWVNLPE